MKKYMALKDNGQKENFLRIETYYSLGGMNYWTSKNENRGYYIAVIPVEKRGCTESFTGFSGIKQCIKVVSRKSEKAEREADELGSMYESGLIDYVLSKNNLELEVNN